MKIALVTASIGGIDILEPPPEQSINFDYYAFTEKNLPVPLPNMNDRMKARYLKIMMHRILPHYNCYVWVDGCVNIKSKFFLENITDGIGVYDFCIPRHPQRKTVGEEMDFIINNIKEKNEYLSKRYDNQLIESEKKFYSQTNTYNLQLYATTFFARNNSNEVNKACDNWWVKVCEYTNFEQAMFSYITLPLIINNIDYKVYSQQMVIIKSHEKLK